MKLSTHTSRFTGALALILGMLAMFLGAQPAAAQTGDSTIEVHNRVCPADYAGESWYEDCHANVADPGLPFTFSDGVTREGTTNENGNVGFANLPAGTYTVTGGAPGEFTDYFVYCSTEGTNEQIPVNFVTGGVQLDLPESTNVVCDWYTIPLSQDGGDDPTPTVAEPGTGDGSIEVHNRVCPQGYEGENWYQDCHANAPDPGLPFTFADGATREGTTNENGNVGFANLPAGTYTVTGGAPGEFTDYFVYCSTESTGEQIAAEYVTGGIQLDLPANTNIVCDWYTIPLSQNGESPTPTATVPADGDSSIEVHNRVCPEGYEGENWFEDCHANVADPGLPFTFSDGVTREGTTNENGNVGFANLPTATYSITGGAPGEFTDYFVYCATEATGEQVPVDYVTGGITVDLAASTNLVCDWYTIPMNQNGQTPTPTESAAGDSSIEVHHRICPTEYEGDTWFEDCHGDIPDPGLSFTFADGVSREGTTNENGNVGFANLPSGTYSITGGVPGEFAEHVVYCSNENTNEQIATENVTGGVQLDLPANTNVVCDWYEIPFDLQGDPTATAPSADQFDLPIYTLLCDTEPAAGAGSDFVMMGTVPTGCEQYAGATVEIAAADGGALGSCETAADAPCYVTVTVGTAVSASIDPATLPEDYAVADEQTQEVEIPPASEAWVLFVAVPSVQTPEPQPTETPVPTETPTAPAETPETPQPQGRMLALHQGTCAPGEPGDILVELPDLTGPDLGPDTNADVIIAETSTSTVEPTLDELMTSEHALIAYSDGNETPSPVACTAIDGEMNADGELVLGVQEVNDSGFAGIVYLAPAEGTGQTRISVFLAEGIVENDEIESVPTQTPVG